MAYVIRFEKTGTERIKHPTVPLRLDRLGNASLMFSLFLLSPLGIIYGHLGLRAYERGEASSTAKNFSIIGLILGYLGLAPWLFIVISILQMY